MTHLPDQSTALELSGVSKKFGGIDAIVDVDLKMAAGESRALIGPNGAGKSTLFNLITGELPLDKGEITIFGHNLTREPVRRRIGLGVGRTYQTSNLFMDLTVEQNLFLAVWRKHGQSTGVLNRLFKPWRKYSKLRDAAAQVAELVGLNHAFNTKVSELSHGEHRQLELGITLAHQPRLLFLDEPMAGLSANERIFMTDLIIGLGKTITILIIEHDIDIAFAISNQVSVLHQGRIIAQGSPEQVKANQDVQEIYTLSNHKGNRTND